MTGYSEKRCPKCNKNGTVEFKEVIYLGEVDPHLDGNFHEVTRRMTCPKCKGKMRIKQSLREVVKGF